MQNTRVRHKPYTRQTHLLSKSLKNAKAITQTVDKSVGKFIVKKPYHTLGITAAIFLCLGYFLNH